MTGKKQEQDKSGGSQPGKNMPGENQKDQLLPPEAEKYIRESGSIEDLPSAEQVKDAERVEEKNKNER